MSIDIDKEDIMAESLQDYITTYSFNRLEETARTFRRLGEAYEDAYVDTLDTVNGGDTVMTGISKQLLLVADVLEECVTMNLYSKDMDKSVEKELFRKCFLAGVRIKNITMIEGKSGMTELAFQARTVGRSCISAKKLFPILFDVLGADYYVPGSCRTIINEEFHQYIFIQESRFKMLSGVARRGKGTSRYNGDNFLISRLDCGKTVAAIADGMGSGKRAFAESRMVIELMENCIDAGFQEQAALELINTAYIAGGGKGVHPVTMDMSVIDCKTGLLSCIKLGAAATFIKRESEVEVIESTTLPLGVLEKIDYTTFTRKLFSGDYVIMISDGLLDNISGVYKEEKMADIIKNISVRKPDAMAEEIMRKSLKCNGGKPSDDMTVLVLGLFDTYDK